MTQHEDEELLLKVAAAVYPGMIERVAGETSLRVWTPHEPVDHPDSAVSALALFRVCLGVLRAWNAQAGELADETRGGLGRGSVRDSNGGQYIFTTTVLTYSAADTIDPFASSAAQALIKSSNLRNSLWLNGRQDRTAADYYMIHEFAKREFHGTKGITSSLGLSKNWQERLTKSANNLSFQYGGRHAGNDSVAVLGLADQKEYGAELLRRWIVKS